VPEKVDRKYEKIAITLPSDLAQAVREEAKACQSRSLSAFIAEALRERLERDGLQKVLDDIFTEKPMTDEERQWADDVLTRR
jgi:hypothetical protein